MMAIPRDGSFPGFLVHRWPAAFNVAFNLRHLSLAYLRWCEIVIDIPTGGKIPFIPPGKKGITAFRQTYAEMTCTIRIRHRDQPGMHG